MSSTQCTFFFPLLSEYTLDVVCPPPYTLYVAPPPSPTHTLIILELMSPPFKHPIPFVWRWRIQRLANLVLPSLLSTSSKTFDVVSLLFFPLSRYAVTDKRVNPFSPSSFLFYLFVLLPAYHSTFLFRLTEFR